MMTGFEESVRGREWIKREPEPDTNTGGGPTLQSCQIYIIWMQDMGIRTNRLLKKHQWVIIGEIYVHSITH